MLHPFNPLGKHVLGSTNLPANYDATTTGTPVLTGASNAEGSWTPVIASNAHETTWVVIDAVGFAWGGGISLPTLLDIGFDAAGGTTYVEKISNLLIGNGGSGTGYSGVWYAFPLRIPSGARVAARAQCAHTSAINAPVTISTYGRSARPETMFSDESFEVVGAVTNSSGVSFTPGNASWGSYVSLGTTAGLKRWWQLGVQLDRATMNNKNYYVELAHGDATNKHTIKRIALGSDTNERVGEFSRANQIFEMSHWPLPAGTNLYVRGMCDGAPDATWTALAYGMCS